MVGNIEGPKGRVLFGFSLALALTLFLYLRPGMAGASGASLYLSPASGTFFIGDTFNVSIFINTGGEDVNAVEANLKFDPTKIQIASPTTGRSFIEIWVTQPSYSNVEGVISLVGGVPSPGINTSAGLVSTLTLRAVVPGETSIVFLDSSKVLRNDPEGTDILTSRGRGVYTILIPPPEGPRVFSPTHPDQNRWYKNNNPTFSWEKEGGVIAFSYNFDRDPSGVPDNKPEGDHTSVSFSGVEDGMWYFHIKAKKADVWGGTSHYLVRVDTAPPADFTPVIEPSPKTTERQPLVVFFSTDALSGLDHYQLRYIDTTIEKKEKEVGFFVEVSSPHKLPPLETGTYLIIVRAFDVAGNWKEGTARVQVFPAGISFTKKGIQFRGMVLPWWWLIAILLAILILVLIYFLRKRQRLIRNEKEKLNQTKEKLGDLEKKVQSKR